MADGSTPCPFQPPCGGDTTSSLATIIFAIFGGLGTGVTIIGAISDAAVSTAPIPFLGIAGQGVGVIGLSAVAAAVAVVVAIFSFWWDRCLQSPDSQLSCSAGVVNDVHASFDIPANYLFPFTAQHDMVSVVLKCIYWPLVQLGAQNIKCDPFTKSPTIHCYFYNPAVCAAEAGSFIGGVLGAVGGIVLGIIVGAAIGCAGTGPLYVFCLLLACLIAALIAAVAALIGACIGGNIGNATTQPSQPSDPQGNAIEIGEYITTMGDTTISGDDDNARVYWFVNTALAHGMSKVGAPFGHTDPDENLKSDGCMVPSPPSSGSEDDDVPH